MGGNEALARAIPRVVSRSFGIEPHERATGSAASHDRSRRFEALVAERMDPSHRLATAILGDPTEAEDAVHDAFVSAWRSWPSLRDDSRSTAWFQRIVVNTCRDRLRRASKVTFVDLVSVGPLAAPDPARRTDERIDLRHALERLEPDDRVVLALRYHADFEVVDIARQLGITPGAAASRLHRAKDRLRRIVDRPTNEVIA